MNKKKEKKSYDESDNIKNSRQTHTHTHTHKNLTDRSLGIVHRLLPEV